MGPRHISRTGKVINAPLGLYDRWLFLAVVIVLALGLLMVASSSIVISEKRFGMPFYYFFKQVIYVGLGTGCALLLIRLDIKYWQKLSVPLLILSILALLLVLVPGIGRSVNGSYRWLGIGPLGFQVSEFAKLALIVYMAGYLNRHHQAVQHTFYGFVRPLLVVGILAFLLLKEPDFGAVVVMSLTVLGMLFIANARLWQFILLLILAAIAIGFLAISSPYRMARLTSFLNPWANQYDGGYQLTQSLIAFGRGGVSGVGLGESVQKLFYLPEAHTDFLLAVVGEELGLIAICTIIVLYSVICIRGMMIARYAELAGQKYAAFLAYGLTLWLSIQAMINMGVNLGLLPTKGLTLPLMSSGGSSMIVSIVAIALLLRIDYESRWQD